MPILPDGSSFLVASLPLPIDHWLYAPCAGWDVARNVSADTPAPLLHRDYAEHVKVAARYAIRASTLNGKDMNFDPDAMVQNFIYALCGPAGSSLTNKT